MSRQIIVLIFNYDWTSNHKVKMDFKGDLRFANHELWELGFSSSSWFLVGSHYGFYVEPKLLAMRYVYGDRHRLHRVSARSLALAVDPICRCYFA